MLPPSQQDSEKESIAAEKIAEIAKKVRVESLQEDGSHSTPSPEKTEDDASSMSLLIDKLIRRLIDTPNYRRIAAGALFIFISISVIISADSDDTRVWMAAAGTVVLIWWGNVWEKIGWIKGGIMLGLVLAFVFLYFFSGKAQEGLYKLKDDWKERHMQIENLHQPSD